MKFCSECAHPISILVPKDDNRDRHVCSHCGLIHYQNPKIIVGSIPIWTSENKIHVLLCRRAIEPRLGYWTLPAGFMENDETTTEAAQRETLEEAGARVQLHDLFSMLNVSYTHQVHLFYRATLLDLNYQAGIESIEVKLFTETTIPWDEIAFSSVTHTLQFFFRNLREVNNGGTYRLHTQDILKKNTSENTTIAFSNS